MEQNRWDSKLLQSSLVITLVWLVKELLHFELGLPIADAFITILFFGISTLSQINNPKERDKL